MTKAIIYARVSTAVQAEHGTSLDTQTEEAKNYAASKSFEVVGEFRDDLSGTTPLDERPGLMGALRMAGEAQVGVLLVYDEDRLARDELVYFSVRNRFEEAGCSLDFVRGGSTSDEREAMYSSFKAIFAAHERSQIRERTGRAKREVVRRGKVLVFDRPPFGYRKGDGNLDPHPEEAETVSLIFELFAREGLTISGVARKLTTLGRARAADRNPAILKGAQTRATRQGVDEIKGFGEWGRSSIHKILHNSTYKGEWHYNKHGRDKAGKRKQNPEADWIGVEVPALVTPEIWALAQVRLKQNKAVREGRPAKHSHPLIGRVRCSCGRRFARVVRTQKGKDWQPYVY